jgi:heat shock protein beta
MFERNKDKRNIKLYVKKVLVLNELDKEMLPDWMSFIVGVFDSPDLPLNVSREVLQQTKIVKAMKTQLKKQISNMIADLFSNDVKYNTFYENFHRHLKLGIHEGDESLLSYLKLKNSKNDQLISFDTYIEELKQNEEQKTIYYATGSEFSENTIVKLYLEKGYHLLYFDEPIDEFVLQRITKYKEYELVNVAKDHTTPWHQEIDESQKQELKEFTDWIKKTLDDTNIEDVRISTKLTGPSDDPIFILGSKWGWTGQMEKIMKAQPLGDSKNMSFMKGKKIVEINFGNPIICNIKQSYIDKETDAANQLKLIYQCSLLSAGYPLENTSSFVKNIYSSLNESINISS